ncbi:MAG: hypothetical protein R3B82_20945 [Sandaracinaceae bacterium]
MTAERALRAALLAAWSALALGTGCLPGPAAECRAGQEEPRCPPPPDLFRTTYAPVCGQGITSCSGGARVVAPDGQPTCDPAAPADGPVCADGHIPYCHLADCRRDGE